MFRLFQFSAHRLLLFLVVAPAWTMSAQPPASQPGEAQEQTPSALFKADSQKWTKIVGDQSGFRDVSGHAQLAAQLVPLHQEMARLKAEMEKTKAQLRPSTQPIDPALADASLLPWQESELIAVGDQPTIALVKAQASSTNPRIARVGRIKMLVGQWLAGPDATAQNKTADEMTAFLKTCDLSDRAFAATVVDLLYFGRGATPDASDKFYSAFKAAFPGPRMELDADNAQSAVAEQQWRRLVGDGSPLRDPAARERIRPELVALDQTVTNLTKQIAADRAILRPARLVERMAEQDARLSDMRQCILIAVGDEGAVARAKADAASADAKIAVIGQIKLLTAEWLTDADESAQNKTADQMAVLLKKADVNDQTAVNAVEAIFSFDGTTPAAEDYWQHAIAAGFPYAQLANHLKAFDAKKQVAQNTPENNPIVLAGTTVDGKPFSTTDWKGKVILVDFWASWCGPCKAELPHVKKLYQTYHEKGFEVLGVDNDYTEAALQKYLAGDHDMVWPNLFDEASASQHGWNSITSKYGITGIPVMFLIDKNGILRTMKARENMDEMIPKLLAETAPPATRPATMPMPAETWKMRTVLPTDTDSRIDSFSGDGWMHCVYFNPDVPRKNQLVVFLPGTFGKGSGATRFNDYAADLGFHVVSLAYPSVVSMSLLNESEDADAFSKARSNVIYGSAPYQIVTVTPVDSIDNRLVKLLEYLAKQYPQENWGQYLDGKGSVVWSKLILAGQSQGGGHAPFIAKQHEVARVLMFGAPKDFNVHFNQPAKWFSDPSATPIDRYFSFVHEDDNDNGCTYPQQLENYKGMGLMPRYSLVNVDETAYPYNHTRLLTSELPGEHPHGAPLSNPVYSDVWKYMLTEPAETRIAIDPKAANGG